MYVMYPDFCLLYLLLFSSGAYQPFPSPTSLFPRYRILKFCLVNQLIDKDWEHPLYLGGVIGRYLTGVGNFLAH